MPTSSNLLRLNVGIGRIGQLEGLPRIQPDGRFVIVWKFDPGHGVLHPWFSVGTLSESAFPYAPGTSKQIVVSSVSPSPPLLPPRLVWNMKSSFFQDTWNAHRDLLRAGFAHRSVFFSTAFRPRRDLPSVRCLI